MNQSDCMVQLCVLSRQHLVNVHKCVGQLVPGTQTKFSRKKAGKVTSEECILMMRAQLHTLPMDGQDIFSDWLTLNLTLDGRIGRHYFNAYVPLA